MSVGWLPETYCRTVDVNLGKYGSLSQCMVSELTLRRVDLIGRPGNIMLLNDLAVWQPEFKQ